MSSRKGDGRSARTLLPLTWLADDAPIPAASPGREMAWQPDGRGFVKLTVIDAKGRADRVTVRVR